MIEIVSADAAHVDPIARDMRAADRIECRAFGDTPQEALRSGIDRSLWSLTAMEGGEAIAMMGVVARNMIAGHGVPWLLGTNRIYDNPRALIQFGKPVIAEMRSTFALLENFVSIENDRAISFLRHFGWEMSEETYLISGVKFARFS